MKGSQVEEDEESEEAKARKAKRKAARKRAANDVSNLFHTTCFTFYIWGLPSGLSSCSVPRELTIYYLWLVRRFGNSKRRRPAKLGTKVTRRRRRRPIKRNPDVSVQGTTMLFEGLALEKGGDAVVAQKKSQLNTRLDL